MLLMPEEIGWEVKISPIIYNAVPWIMRIYSLGDFMIFPAESLFLPDNIIALKTAELVLLGRFLGFNSNQFPAFRAKHFLSS